jgi:hypothetical protein
VTVDPVDRACHPVPDMSKRGVCATVVALVLGSRGASAEPRAFVDTDFGSSVGGLQLSVTVNADGSLATFYVKNVGPTEVTFVEAYSCSGHSPWSITTSATGVAGQHDYGFEPKVRGLTTEIKTVCTRNVATKHRTVAKGATVAIDVPFATAGEITKTKDTVVQANAVLDLDGRDQPLVLHSKALTR